MPEPGRVPSVTTAYGLVALRKRYIRRSKFLADDQEFQSACEKERQAWNRDNERYTLPSMMHESGLPAALERDFPSAKASFERAELRRNDLPDEEESAAEHYAYEYKKQERRLQDPTLKAYDHFQWAVWRLVNVFFPEEDFLPLFDGAEHPASSFIGWAIGSLNVRTLGDRAEELIDVRLDVREALADQDDPVLALGLYPGVTARDICDAAPAIAEKVNDRYANRLPLVRIHTLRADGLTQQAIGDRLGLTRRAVMDALALPDPR